MYIAIEGIKGSGKSTVYNLLCKQLYTERLECVSLQPTQPAPVGAPVEWLYRHTAPAWPDCMVERLYAWRSNHHARRVPKRHGLILGERSILTSYVTRWNARNPERGMARVDALEHAIPVPDHVIYLQLPVEQALKRFAARHKRTYGLRDQTPQRLHQAANVYRTLLTHGSRLGLGNVTWHVVDATAPITEVLEHATNIIKKLLSQGPVPKTRAPVGCTLERGTQG